MHKKQKKTEYHGGAVSSSQGWKRKAVRKTNQPQEAAGDDIELTVNRHEKSVDNPEFHGNRSGSLSYRSIDLFWWWTGRRSNRRTSKKKTRHRYVSICSQHVWSDANNSAWTVASRSSESDQRCMFTVRRSDPMEFEKLSEVGLA